MVYLLDGDQWKIDALDKVNTLEGKEHLCLLRFEELTAAAPALGIGNKIVDECLKKRDLSKFESHFGFDFITLSVPDDEDQRREHQRICIYMSESLLVFVCDDHTLFENMFSEMEAQGMNNITTGKILHLFFDQLTLDDALVLEKIEQEISELEEDLIVSSKDNLIDIFTAFRRRLLALKRYYEQLLEISEAIEQNENGLLDERVLRYFRILTHRVNRLFSGVLNLRDYVTQVREAYQAQIDINLNKVMKVFTVVTSVFLPLTVIVGWYGMNLQMPEFGWHYGYPFVILLSVGSLAFILYYFKKNKWF